MIDPEDYTHEETLELGRIVLDMILIALILLLWANPILKDWRNSIIEYRHKQNALTQTYETLDAPVIDVTFENGITYNDVKAVYKRDWDETHWVGQRPDIGYWCTEDGRVIIKKGSCNVIQSAH